MQKIDKMLGSFTINMDPSNYRRLYRDKAFRETLNLPSVPSQGPSNTLNNQAGNQGQCTSGHYNVRASANMMDKTFLSGLNTSTAMNLAG